MRWIWERGTEPEATERSNRRNELAKGRKSKKKTWKGVKGETRARRSNRVPCWVPSSLASVGVMLSLYSYREVRLEVQICWNRRCALRLRPPVSWFRARYLFGTRSAVFVAGNRYREPFKLFGTRTWLTEHTGKIIPANFQEKLSTIVVRTGFVQWTVPRKELALRDEKAHSILV